MGGEDYKEVEEIWGVIEVLTILNRVMVSWLYTMSKYPVTHFKYMQIYCL